MMKISRILKYLFISFLFLIPLNINGQNNEEWFPSQGFTLGVNLAGPFTTIINNERNGFSFLTRISVKDQFNLYGELGFENVNFEKPEYHYNSNGSFFKLGLERNILKTAEAGRIDNLLVGAFYGFAVQQHGASRIFIPNGYWDNHAGRMGAYAMSSHWFEISGGPRMELFKNFFVGWSMHLRILIYRNNSNIMDPYLIPGYGNGGNVVNASFSYNIEYMIPWKKAK